MYGKAKCKFCHRVMKGNGNAHIDCYWAWVHKAMNPLVSLGVIEGQTKEGVGRVLPVRTLDNRGKTPTHAHTGPIDYD